MQMIGEERDENRKKINIEIDEKGNGNDKKERTGRYSDAIDMKVGEKH